MRKYENPREEIWEMIHTDLNNLLVQAGKLHGHYCPYLALGVKAGAKGITELDVEHEGMEEVIAIVEANNCFSDGIQYSTGCTFGNNSLVYRDYGKTAVTIAHRGEEGGLRVVVKPSARKSWEEEYPEYQEVFNKVVKERSGDERDRERMMDLAQKVSFEVMQIDPEELFKIESVIPELPEYAPIFESVICDACGENVMATRIVERGDEKLCIQCADEGYHELDGRGIHLKRGT
ncbi:MAG: FmdE family protein [Thermoproteota archaeon]